MEKLNSFDGGKADGLVKIKKLKGINVPSFTVVPANATVTEQDNIVNGFVKKYAQVFEKVAVRSSALKEDSKSASFAGAFDTFLNMPLNSEDIKTKVDLVRDNGEQKLSGVFNMASRNSIGVVVQGMVEDPDYAGVCLSQGYSAGEEAYLLINFRQGLGDELVSGSDSGVELRVLRSGNFTPETIAKYPFLPKLVDNLQTIEDYFDGQAVDIEFAAKNNELYILQARPFIVKQKASLQVKKEIEKSVSSIQKEVAEISGDDLLCDMSDINPRELLGEKALPINISLFRDMFADEIVEKARRDIGYDPLHLGLLREMNGKPYVSIKAAAYSLRPIGISNKTYDKIVEIYCDTIKNDPDKQDKVEFAVFIIGAAQLPEFFEKHEGTFTSSEQKEICEAFVNQEKRLSKEVSESYQKYSNFVGEYSNRIENLSLADDIKAVLQEGTEMFVKTARLAFYKKAVCDQIYGDKETLKFLTSLNTPSDAMHSDLLGYAKGEKTTEELASLYGHIRPGQMDIFSEAYRTDIAKNLDLKTYDDMLVSDAVSKEEENEAKRKEMESKINELPAKEKQDMQELRFLMSAREKVKHEFMRAYDLLAEQLKLNVTPYQSNAADVIMPSILNSDSDLSCINSTSKKGTYFGSELVEAAPFVVREENLQEITREDVEGKIIIMDHADPGYDFLLLYNPAGIVTKIGGPASHIAIRVNEYGIPASIGCGVDLEKVDTSKTYVLDCVNKRNYAGKTNLEPVIKKDSKNDFRASQ